MPFICSLSPNLMRIPSFLSYSALALLLAACDTKNSNGMPDEQAGKGSLQVATDVPPKPDSAAARTENPVMPADTSVAGA